MTEHPPKLHTHSQSMFEQETNQENVTYNDNYPKQLIRNDSVHRKKLMNAMIAGPMNKSTVTGTVLSANRYPKF